MDKIKNPFSPGAGSPPPELAGRTSVMEEAEVLIHRVLQKRPEKSMLLTGLRGVGKTVLLNEIERQAVNAGYKTIFVEAHEAKSLGALLTPVLRRVLYDMDRIAAAGDKIRKALGVLASFVSSIRVQVGDIDIGIEPERGSADSGDLEADLSALLVAVAEAAKERQVAVAIMIDEIQYFNSKELSALVMAMHKVQQLQLPLVLIGAGLPVLPGLIGDSKSYAERLFSFPTIGPLSYDDSIRAIAEPIRSAGQEIEPAALEEIYSLTLGYPYFLQEWGYQAWNQAERSPITLADVQEATTHVSRRLDENFFRVRFDRLTPSEKRFLRAMAELGTGPHRLGDIANLLGSKLNQLGTVRASLIKKGMIYSPSHGELAFTVPLFDGFMRRAIPEFNSEIK